MIINRSTLAECLGVTVGRVTQLVNEGMPRCARGKYDLPLCVRWYLDYKLKGGPNVSADVNEARKKLYDEQTIKTKLETSRIRREVIPSDEHMIDMNQLAVMFSSGLDSIGGRLASELAGVSDARKIADLLAHETAAIRESVADAITGYANTLEV